MNILIKQAKVVDKNSPFNGKVCDILIEQGTIQQISESIKASADKVIEGKDLHVSVGFFDFRANFQDPGAEYKEDIYSGMAAAAKGGFTGVLLTSNTTPSVSNKSTVEYILKKSDGNVVSVYPTGTISANLEGVDLSEMYDMQQAGAVAFSDNKKSISQSGLMSRALLYAKNFDGLIMNFPLDKHLAGGAYVNESEVTTRLGLKGIPNLAEELMIIRDLYLAEYHDSPIHIGPISCKESVALIKQAKAKGLKVSCEVAIHNLIYTDKSVETFDSNFKVMPPFRSEEDRNALIQGLIDGTIDVISTDHTPEDVEHKNLEFEYANFGVVGLESFFGSLMTLTKDLISLEVLISKFTVNPRTILKLDVPVIKEGYAANLTLFNTSETYKFSTSESKSKSKNSCFNGCEMTGKIIGVINNNKLSLN
jgi:dihydroorotase